MDVWKKVKYEIRVNVVVKGGFVRRGGISPRQARRMMKRMGLSMDTIPDVEEVIIRTGDKEIIIRDPDVAVMKMKGQNIFQVTGGEVTEEATEQELAIRKEDIRLVADQTGKSLEEAQKALEECEGDLAKAILMLQS